MSISSCKGQGIPFWADGRLWCYVDGCKAEVEDGND